MIPRPSSALGFPPEVTGYPLSASPQVIPLGWGRLVGRGVHHLYPPHPVHHTATPLYPSSRHVGQCVGSPRLTPISRTDSEISTGQQRGLEEATAEQRPRKWGGLPGGSLWQSEEDYRFLWKILYMCRGFSRSSELTWPTHPEGVWVSPTHRGHLTPSTW